MILHLHCSRNLSDLLDEMSQTGKKGTLAASQAEIILDAIRHEGLRSKVAWSKRTKNGEHRLVNCVKYDLGNGYRMVTVRKNNHLFVPFIGGHDKVDYWLEHNRDITFSKDDPSYATEVISVPEEAAQTEDNSNICSLASDKKDAYEDLLASQIDDATLQVIFQGLYR